MNASLSADRLVSRRQMVVAACAVAALLMGMPGPVAPATAVEAPVPLLEKGKKVDWWFAYKFNSQKFAGEKPFVGCGPDGGIRTCPFDKKGKVQTKFGANFSQQYVFASSDDGTLAKGKGCLGMTMIDPLGATFDQVYHGSPFYLIWNDQFYGDPRIEGCGKGNCPAPWGHSKGMLAWNESGEGFVLQVTTPSWPAAGSSKHPRKAGNTLGCVTTQNNLNNAQHFFALKLDKAGVTAVLEALANAGAATDPDNSQIARLGGPADIRALAEGLGEKPKAKAQKNKSPDDVKITKVALSEKVTLISKPPNLNVPPWQMVSALLSGVSERSATWWAKPQIFSTLKSTKIRCWEGELKDKNENPGAVQIAKSGSWDGHEIGLIGGQNHAKVGVTTSGSRHFAIFGDLNQQGSINPVKGRCNKSQNGRGGLFFVVEDEKLFDSMSDLLEGESEPVKKK